MRHLILMGLAFAGLVGCAAPKSDGKTITLDSTAKNTVIEAQSKKIADLEERIKTLSENLESQSSTAIELYKTIEKNEHEICGTGPQKNGSDRYPVTTANSPRAALLAVNEAYMSDGIEPHDINEPLNVRHVKLHFGKTYPDIMCFDFDTGDQTCFDPMEITER
jgi:phosphopantetheine adenylyltransferase